jgi:phage-related protein
MSTEAGRAFVGLGYKTSDISQLERDTERAGQGFLGSWSGFAKKAAIAIGGAFAVREVFSFGKDVVEEAAQTQKAVESIRAGFGKSAESVLAFGEGAAKQFGIAREASDQFSSAIAVAGRNIGLTQKQSAAQAIGWQQLAGAVGQIKGQDPAGYFASLQRVMVGNARGLKQLGISFSTTEEQQAALRLGIRGTSADWTAGQKAQILYQVAMRHLPELMKQAAAHSNDLVDTQRRLTAEWANVKADLGDALLPVITKFVGVLANNLPGAFRIASETAKLFGRAIDAIVNSSAALAVVEHVVQPIKDAFHSLVGFITTTKNQFDSFRASGLSLGKAIQDTLVTVLVRLGVSWGTSERIIGDVVQGLNLARGAFRTIAGAIGNALEPLTKFHVSADQLKGALQSTIGFVTKYKEVFIDVGSALGIVVGALVAYTAATEAWAAVTRIATAVQLAFDAAMAALPIIAVGIAIVALVAAVIYLYRHNQTAREVIQTAWRAIEGIITGTLHVVTAVIRTFVTVALGFWHTFGGAITKVARTDFNVVVGVIRGVLKIVEGVIKVGLGIIHGNWSQAWSGIKEIARGALGIVVSIIRGAIGLATAAAKALGAGVLHGVEGALSGLAGFVRQKIGAIPGVIRSIAGAVADAAKAIGQAIIHGIETGVTGLASSLASSVKNTVTGALGGLGSALGIGSPSRWTRDHIGIPIIQGILAGFDQAGPDLSTTLNKHVGKALAVPLPSAGRQGLVGVESVGPAQFSFDGTVLLDGKEVGRLVDVRIKRADQRRGRNLSAGRTWQPA